MARGGRGGGNHPAGRRLIDLSGFITASEKADYVLLVTAITEKLLNDLSNIFDSPPLSRPRDDHSHHHWLSLSVLQSRSHNILPHKPGTPQHGGSAKHGGENYSKAHEIIEKEEHEAMTPQLQELKKEALIYFKKWQMVVLTRLRDVAVTTSEPAQGSTRGRGRVARAVGRGRMARGGRGNGRGPPPPPPALGFGPPRTPSDPVDRELALQYPPLPNHLWTLAEEKRKLLLHITLLLLLSMHEYTANGRMLLLTLSSSLNLPLRVLQNDEMRLAKGLAQTALDVPELEEDGDNKTEETGKGPRKWKASLGHTISSAPVLSSPLIDVGLGSPRSGLGIPQMTAAALLGGMSDNGKLIGALFGMSPARPASKSLECFAREIQDFALLPLHGQIRGEYRDARETRAQDRRLRIVVGMAGWLTDKDGPVRPWECLGHQAESYAMRWELATLTNLGNSLETVIKSTAWSRADQEIRTRPIFSTIAQSQWPGSLLKVSKIIDNPWSVGMVRAEKAGSVLADALMRGKFQGDRPVSLIGFSLASRAIYTCLMILAERRQFGLVESVALMGLPAPSESRVWLTLKSVVSGRLINVYSEHDYILGFLYRTSNIHLGVAGLQEIQGAYGVENHRVSLTRGHLSYQSLAPQILKDIGWEDLEWKNVRPERPSTHTPSKTMGVVSHRVDEIMSVL